MNCVGCFLKKSLCSGPFSYTLGLGLGLVAFYILDRAKEKQRLEETQREIEAMIKALERKLQQET